MDNIIGPFLKTLHNLISFQTKFSVGLCIGCQFTTRRSWQSFCPERIFKLLPVLKETPGADNLKLHLLYICCSRLCHKHKDAREHCCT